MYCVVCIPEHVGIGKVEGVVKEKEEAKKEFQEAVRQGYTASLGSEETKDSTPFFLILDAELV